MKFSTASSVEHVLGEDRAGPDYDEPSFQRSGNLFKVTPNTYVKPCLSLVSPHIMHKLNPLHLSVSEGAAVRSLNIHTRPLEGTQHLHSPDFNTFAIKSSYRPILSHTVAKQKLNPNKLSSYRCLHFLLLSLRKRRSLSSTAKDNHPSPWSAEVPSSRNASLGRLFTAPCKGLIFKG